MELVLSEQGTYRHEIYNTISQYSSTFECSSSKEFIVVLSETPIITALDTTEQSDGLHISITVEGIGNYEYALDTIDGPYQENAFFEGVDLGVHTVYIRDKNGCGVAEKSTEKDVDPKDFPAFFTPNGDGINDFWQYVSSSANEGARVENIQVFDRYGMLLTQIEPDSQGWDGNLSGLSLPSSDYWFKATLNNGKEFKGHFALKR